LKRVGVGFRVAPRPWLDSMGIRPVYAHGRTKQEHMNSFRRSEPKHP
jgi:hypothetical protein